MLQESKRAYIQLDETYKGLIDKALNEKAAAIKASEKSYQVKVKCKLFCWFRHVALEDTVRQLKQTTDDQKRYIDSLEAQKIDMKLDFDTQIFNI